MSRAPSGPARAAARPDPPVAKATADERLRGWARELTMWADSLGLAGRGRESAAPRPLSATGGNGRQP